MNTKTVGDRTEAQVLAALLSAGYVVLQPFGDNQRYDLVIDVAGSFRRVQCKTGRLVSGAVDFATASVDRDAKTRQAYYGQADYFGVYCPELGKAYLVPVDILGKRAARLRVEPAKSNRVKDVRWAAEFEVTVAFG